jgi:hypothetical protein
VGSGFTLAYLALQAVVSHTTGSVNHHPIESQPFWQTPGWWMVLVNAALLGFGANSGETNLYGLASLLAVAVVGFLTPLRAAHRCTRTLKLSEFERIQSAIRMDQPSVLDASLGIGSWLGEALVDRLLGTLLD